MNPLGVVGHVAIDRIISAEGVRQQLGGSPTYISLITHLLGVQIDAATRVGGDFPEEYIRELNERGVRVRIDTTAKTTRFLLDYTKLERGLGYDSLCSPIEPIDVEGQPDATILAPIVGEIPCETLKVLRSQTLALDPQGFVRRLEPGGVISLEPWRDLALLRRISVFKASTRELRFVAGKAGWEGLGRLADLGIAVAVETLGADGARLLHSGRRMIIPAYSGVAVDTTGAGDAFIAGFMADYADGEEVEWCAAVGSAAASAVVETVGPKVKISKAELFARAEKLQDGLRVLP